MDSFLIPFGREMLKDDFVKKKKISSSWLISQWEVLTVIDKNDTNGHCPDGTLKNIVRDKSPIKGACHKIIWNLYYALGLF